MIQQGYSTKNSGDGLLVDLTVELVKEALGDSTKFILFANDPESFEKYEPVLQVQCTSRKKLTRLTHSFFNLLKIFKYLAYSKAYSYPLFQNNSTGCNLIIGVGGGYLRGKGFLESVKCLINNTTQLLWAKHSNIPYIYLPQSVGPFSYKFHQNLIVKSLNDSELICCRDNRSIDICSVDSAIRVPDLAVMKLAKDFNASEIKKNKKRRFLLVCRAINGNKNDVTRYIDSLKHLKEKYDMEIVLQSTGRGNDDLGFCNHNFGTNQPRTLQEALEDGNDYIILSVRLHGSMQSLLKGHPSIHLSYERKGYGAYEDLGLNEFVFNAFDLDTRRVEEAISKLQQEEEVYWDHISNNVEKILQQRESLKIKLKKVVEREKNA